MIPGRAGDRAWAAILLVSFLFGVGASWHRWGNLLIDTGREMNQPLRLASGERLYAEVRHIYGPISPWLHAALFRQFGPSLNILYADGVVTAVLVLTLVYWLARQLMAPAPAGAATLSVMFLCVFKPSGNYILPYSYSAVHGTALGLLTLAALVSGVRADTRRQGWWFVLAGTCAGLAVLAKAEAGAAAIAAGLAAAWAASSDWRPRAVRATAFMIPAALWPAVVYAAIASEVGWTVLVEDSWLLLYNVPAELRRYNAWISGMDRPLHSLGRMLIAIVKLALLAAVIASISNIMVRRRETGVGTEIGPDPNYRRLAGAILVALALSLTIGLDWDTGPYIGMPILLGALLAALGGRFGAAGLPTSNPSRAVLMTCAVFALVSLTRILLHVRSGGAHAAYLLPVSVVLFTYLWVGPFASGFSNPRAGRLAATIVVSLIAIDAAATALIQAYRYRSRQTVTVSTPRGTTIAAPELGAAWNEALAYIQAHTRPGDFVAVMPEGTSLTFLSGRRNPLREEIATPGYLDGEGEADAIWRLSATRTPLILVPNRPTAEFGATALGRDYNRRLMGWVERHYQRCAMLGPGKDPALEVGDGPFFVRAYCAR